MIPSQRGYRVARGCRRSSAGKAGKLRRISVGPTLLLALAIGSPALSALADESRPPDSIASVAVADELALSDAGRRKSEALGLYFKGLMLESALRIPEQIECYRQVLELDPGNVTLAMETANLCAAYGRFDEARVLLEENLDANPHNARAYLNLSQFCLTYQNGDDTMMARALAIARKAQEAFPRDAEVCVHLCTLLLEKGNMSKARAVAEKALSLTGGDALYWLQLGEMARKLWPFRIEGETNAKPSGNRGRVNAVFEKALAVAPESLEVAQTVGDYFSTTLQFGRARDLYAAIIRAHPDALEVRERLVHVFRTLGEDDKARSTLEELVSIDPTVEKTRALLAEMYADAGEHAKSIAQFEQILRMKDGDVADYEELAERMMGIELYGNAERLLLRGRTRFPDSPVLSHKLAITYSFLDRPEEALAQWDATAAMAESEHEGILSADFYHYYGAAADAAGQFDRAADYFRKAIDLIREGGDETEAAKSLNYLGYMWLEQNVNVDGAGELIRRAMALEPNAPEYIDSLGWFYFRKGRFEEALESFLKTHELMKNPDPVVLDHIGQTYHALGNPGEAARYLTRALELQPDNTEIQARLKAIGTQPSADESPKEAATATPRPREKAA